MCTYEYYSIPWLPQRLSSSINFMILLQAANVTIIFQIYPDLICFFILKSENHVWDPQWLLKILKFFVLIWQNGAVAPEAGATSNFLFLIWRSQTWFSDFNMKKQIKSGQI